MPYYKYNLFYKNKTRKPRMTEYHGNLNNRRQNTHNFKLIPSNNLNNSIKNFGDHSTDFASKSIVIQDSTNSEPIVQTQRAPSKC